MRGASWWNLGRIGSICAAAIAAGCGDGGSGGRNHPPVAAPDAASTDEDTAIHVVVLGNDVDDDGDALAVIAVGTPASGAATVNTDGSIVYVPAADFHGIDGFTYTVEDGHGDTAEGNVSVQVRAVNDQPFAADDAAATAEEAAVLIDLLGNDGDPDGDAATVLWLGEAPNGTVELTGQGEVRYSPDPDFNGTDAFAYTIGDGAGGAASGVVTVAVSPVNDAPFAQTQSLQTLEDASHTAVLLASDVEGDTLTYSVTSGPANGTLTGTAPDLVYVPDPNFFGTDSFTFAADDGGLDTAATVTIEVLSVQDAPVAANDVAQVDAAGIVALGVLANDSDGDGDPLTVAYASATQGAATAMPDGTVEYSAPLGFIGTDTVSYTIKDGQGGTDTAIVEIEVFFQVERVSVDSSGLEGNGFTTTTSISGDGRFVAYISFASNLVAGDSNASPDVFVHDRQTGATERVSVDSSGAESNGNSSEVAISDDGRFVAFRSGATNLVSGDTNAASDIFVHDRQTGATERVSVDSSGVEGNASSIFPCISADGRFVAFQSLATNLVSGDTNGRSDVFVRDQQLGTTERVSISVGETEGDGNASSCSISDDGRFVAFESSSTNLVSGDTNASTDIFVRDRSSGLTLRVSVDSEGTEADGFSGDPAISEDGRYVAFVSLATNLVSGDGNGEADIFVRDIFAVRTARISIDSAGIGGDLTSSVPRISDDGRFVVFHSSARNLVGLDLNDSVDIFVRDRWSGITQRLSVDRAGAEASLDSFNPVISADGRHISFTTSADNLAENDLNGTFDALAVRNFLIR